MKNNGVSLKNEKLCLVVVDMINGFLFEGALCDPHIDCCTEPIRQLIERFLQHHQPVVAFRDSHQKDSREFADFPEHCLENSHESELIDALKPYQDQMIVLLKNSTNGFVQPQFESTLKSLLPLDKIVITGCCTDLCVLHFALSLKGYLNEHNLSTEVIVPENCVDTFEAAGHPRAAMSEMALTMMKNAGILVLESLEVNA